MDPTKLRALLAKATEDRLRTVLAYIEDSMDRGPGGAIMGNLYSARDEIDRALEGLTALLDALDRQAKELAAFSRAEDQLIDERDNAEEALSQAYFLVTGRSPEWSSLFGHEQALEDIDDAQSTLRQTVSSQAKELEGLREARDRVLAYRGPKWPDEMTLREKVRFEFTGDINKPECPPDQDPAR